MVVRKIYLSGAISGNPDYKFQFLDQEQRLKRIYGDNVVVLNPSIFPDGLSQHDYMQLSIVMLNIADAVMMLDGWENSHGARVERDYALKCNKYVFNQGDI